MLKSVYCYLSSLSRKVAKSASKLGQTHRFVGMLGGQGGGRGSYYDNLLKIVLVRSAKFNDFGLFSQTGGHVILTPITSKPTMSVSTSSKSRNEGFVLPKSP